MKKILTLALALTMIPAISMACPLLRRVTFVKSDKSHQKRPLKPRFQNFLCGARKNCVFPTKCFVRSRLMPTATPRHSQIRKELAQSLLLRSFCANKFNYISKNIDKSSCSIKLNKELTELDEKSDCYRATFSNLGISRVIIDSQTVKKHPRLLKTLQHTLKTAIITALFSTALLKIL